MWHQPFFDFLSFPHPLCGGQRRGLLVRDRNTNTRLMCIARGIYATTALRANKQVARNKAKKVGEQK
jgi:hypothetical protein